jgi:hypothetical protein
MNTSWTILNSYMETRKRSLNLGFDPCAAAATSAERSGTHADAASAQPHRFLPPPPPALFDMEGDSASDGDGRGGEETGVGFGLEEMEEAEWVKGIDSCRRRRRRSSTLLAAAAAATSSSSSPCTSSEFGGGGGGGAGVEAEVEAGETESYMEGDSASDGDGRGGCPS